MKKPFAPLGCAIHSHVRPNDRRSWDAGANTGFNLRTFMEHHRCYRVYITKMQATRVSNTVNFKHQYITNPTVSPESLVIAVAQQLTAALKGNIPGGNETMEGLTKVSKMFTRRSQAGGHMFMASDNKIPKNNRAVLNILQIIRAVMSSAAEAKLGTLFINAKAAVSI